MTLIDKLQKDFAQFNFELGEVCHWSSELNTIFYTKDAVEETLLHELGHALLSHKDFSQDIELIHMERDAWTKAQEIAQNYGVKISEDTIEEALDSYREWLHRRSLCPNCQQTGLQDNKTGDYLCINCRTKWQPNDARQKQLRRKIKQ